MATRRQVALVADSWRKTCRAAFDGILAKFRRTRPEPSGRDASPSARAESTALAGIGGEARDERAVLAEQLERLTTATQSLVRDVEQLQRYHPLLGSLRRLLWRGFLYGVSHGLGYAVGASVIVAALVWLAGQLEVVPVLGEWIAGLVEAIKAAQGVRTP